MIVGTAGHIDHGKTSLVRALTGVDTDRLKEEKARGITIELGFAYWKRPGGTIGLVDVPGHEKLVHTMLAGATGIDLFLLVVAADDGPMPQTREHLAIADILGLERGIVALTKSDLVTPDRLVAAEAEVRAVLQRSALAAAPILPVSAATGQGIGTLAGAIDQAATDLPTRPASDGFRMAIDRVFTLQGAGTVVTGTIIGGRVTVGDRLTVSPAGIEARVRSLHAQNAAVDTAAAGQRSAVALTGPRISVDAIPRGAMLLSPPLHAPTRRIDVVLRVLRGEQKSLAQWSAVRLHHGAGEVTARLVPLSADAIPPGQEGFAQIVLDTPLAAAVGDRFVLRDVSATRTIGGGTILDLAGPERRRRTVERLAELEQLALCTPDEALAALLGGPRGWIDPETWLRDRGAMPAGAADLVARLGLVALPRPDGKLSAFSPAGWARVRGEIATRLDAAHSERPDLPGLGQERLRLSLSPRMPTPVFQAVLARLTDEGVARPDRSWLRRPWFEVRMSPEEEETWRRLLPLLGGTARFRPPRVRDIASETTLDEALLRRICRLAARRGDVEELARDHFFLADSVIEMADIVRDLAASAAPGGFPVVDFRNRLDNGRKVAIQILEFFDRQGLTMRRGDIRRINPHKKDLYSRADAAPGPVSGGESSPVGRPDFKSGWGCETVPGGFDSRLLRQSTSERKEGDERQTRISGRT